MWYISRIQLIVMRYRQAIFIKPDKDETAPVACQKNTARCNRTIFVARDQKNRHDHMDSTCHDWRSRGNRQIKSGNSGILDCLSWLLPALEIGLTSSPFASCIEGYSTAMSTGFRTIILHNFPWMWHVTHLYPLFYHRDANPRSSVTSWLQLAWQGD